MIFPFPPPNEAERLAALHALEILDTPAEERFDRITRLARRLFKVPIALISLIDADRQWFKSASGYAGAQTPRSTSFCGHTILKEESLVVEDALADERFHNSPWVAGEPHVRFYAGYPLTVPGGLSLGSLCLVDHQPRAFSEEDRVSLRDLARLAAQELAAFELATTDELTGCCNRRAFKSMARHQLEICRRMDKDARLASFDLSDFRRIHDSYGQAEGDRALLEFVGVLRDSIRDIDLIGRVGGNEFAALLIGKDADIIQRVRRELGRRHTEGLRPYRLHFAAGEVSFDPVRHVCIDQMFEQAAAIMGADRAQA
jgi:diguanylate cyclase (GGDEF)-like protein